LVDVEGEFLVSGGTISNVLVSGSEAYLAPNSSLTVDDLAVNDGATVLGDILLENGGDLTIDANSSLSEGTLTLAGNAAITVEASLSNEPANASISDSVAVDASSVVSFTSTGGGTVSLVAPLACDGVTTWSGNWSLTNLEIIAGGSVEIAANSGVSVDTLALASQSSSILVDPSSWLNIGALAAGTVGYLTVDDANTVAGAGRLDVNGNIIVNGEVEVTLGTLVMGSVIGGGMIITQAESTISFDIPVATSLQGEFQGGGTISLTGLPTQPSSIAITLDQFWPGCTLELPAFIDPSIVDGSPGTNSAILQLDAQGLEVASIGLSDASAGATFNISGSNDGITLLTVGSISNSTFVADQNTAAQSSLTSLLGTQPLFIGSSSTGRQFAAPDHQAINVAVAVQPVANAGIALPAGYSALIAGGSAPVLLADKGNGGSVIVGNSGSDTIVGNANGDTLIGGGGRSTLFYADGSDSVIGSGNDVICTNLAACSVSTASDASSLVFLGPAHNTVFSQGNDIIVTSGGPSAFDEIKSVAADTVYGSPGGTLSFNGGSGGLDTVVGAPGSQIFTIGGDANGTTLFCGGATYFGYLGENGSAVICGGTGTLDVTVHQGLTTVYGGTGATTINSNAGADVYVVGDGPSTVDGGAGNSIWLVGSANDSLVASGDGCSVDGSQSSGNNVFVIEEGTCTLIGGSGADTFIGGQGIADIFAGSSFNSFEFTNGTAGGAVTVNGYAASNGEIVLTGYSGYSSEVVGGNEVIGLSDGTQVTLMGVSSLQNVNIVMQP
jgi:hypothetical protein